MINIGGFIGPFIAGVIMQKTWDYVFYMSILTIGINYLVTAFFFRDPVVRDRGTSIGRTILQAFINIGITLKNWKYVLFLIIMILFWTAFNQLYYSFPVFIDQWIDTSSLYNGINNIWPWLAEQIGTPEGTITSVTLSSMDAFFIIIFQLAVSAFVMRFRPLAAMMGGILILAGGLGLMFSNQNSWLILLGILIFALGEMASSPKFTEYIGRIAPEDKKALYMGTSFLPIAAGHQLAGWLSGGVYEKIADKIFLLGKETEIRGISLPQISEEFTKNDYLEMAATNMGMTTKELSNYLWTQYNPSNIWIVYAGVAVSAVIFLWLYDKFILKSSK